MSPSSTDASTSKTGLITTNALDVASCTTTPIVSFPCHRNRGRLFELLAGGLVQVEDEEDEEGESEFRQDWHPNGWNGPELHHQAQTREERRRLRKEALAKAEARFALALSLTRADLELYINGKGDELGEKEEEGQHHDDDDDENLKEGGSSSDSQDGV
ncbi:hypothetical protein H1R20_g8384, partial [Candolleomyces eurysporus]